MILLSVQELTKRFGPEPVLQGVTFDLRAGEKASLIGPNGAGKTTLLRILAGIDESDTGRVETTGSLRVGYLPQQVEYDSTKSVWEEARSGLQELIQMGQRLQQLAEQLAAAADERQRERLGEQFDRLQHQLHQEDGYSIDHRIQRVLDGLGFARSSYEQPVTQLSGGQRNRLLLATILLRQPDLMLLDEPSNHLDIAATEWLEDFLKRSTQAILLVSHDRFLLDHVADTTLELLDGTVETYRGNYSAYWLQKQQRLLVETRTFEKQRAEIGRMEDFVRRNHYGQKSAQAEDRRKKLERIERVERPRIVRTAPMGFGEVNRSGDVVLRLEHLNKSYAEPLFHDLTLQVQRGEKWAIYGANGTGKTTLLRCVLGEEAPDAGAIHFGTAVEVAYFDQRLEQVPADATPLDAIRPDKTEFTIPQRRDLLARFGVTGEMVHQPIELLSGGERNRVALARLAASQANLMVLDEPTNHLDLWAVDRLEESLRQFAGTVLLVSHDRFFLNRVVDHMLVLDATGWQIVHGNFDTYRQMTAAAARRTLAAAPTTTLPEQAAAPEPHKGKGRVTQRRKRRFPYRKVEDLEAEILATETEIELRQRQLVDPDVLRDGRRVKQVQADIQQQQELLSRLYEHWEEAAELN